MIIFKITLVEIKTKSADILLKVITILKEQRIVQPFSKNEQTLVESHKHWLSDSLLLYCTQVIKDLCIHKKTNQNSSNFTAVLVRIFIHKSLRF